MQPGSGNATGGEAQVKVSCELNTYWQKFYSKLSWYPGWHFCNASPLLRNQVVEMFDHAYQNYMVSEVLADFLHIFLFYWKHLLCVCITTKILLFLYLRRTMRTQLMSWCRWHAEEEFGVWNQVEVMWTTPWECEWHLEFSLQLSTTILERWGYIFTVCTSPNKSFRVHILYLQAKHT